MAPQPDEPNSEVKNVPIKKKPFFAARKKSLNSSAHLKLRRNNMALAKELNKYKEDYTKLLAFFQQSQEEVLSFRHSRNKIKNSLDIIYNKTIDSLRAVGTLADYLHIMHSEVTNAKAYNEVEESLLGRNADKFNHQDQKFRMTLPARLPDLDSHSTGFSRGAKTQSVNPMVSGYAIHKPNIRLRRMELHDMPVPPRHNSNKILKVPRQPGKYPVRRFGPQVKEPSPTTTESPNRNSSLEETRNNSAPEEMRSSFSPEEIRTQSVPEEITISSDEEDERPVEDYESILNGGITDSPNRNSRVARVSLERLPANQLENIGLCMQQIGQECNEVPDFLFSSSSPPKLNFPNKIGRELKISLHDVRSLLNSSGYCKVNDSNLGIVYEHPNDVEYRKSESGTSPNKRLREDREEFLRRVYSENPLEGTSWEYENLLDHETGRQERRLTKVTHRKKNVTKQRSPAISSSPESNQTIYESENNMSLTECVGPYLQRNVSNFGNTNNENYLSTKSKIATSACDSTLSASGSHLMTEELQKTETSQQSEHVTDQNSFPNDTTSENETSKLGRTSTPNNSVLNIKQLNIKQFRKDIKEKESAAPVNENINCSDFNTTNFEAFSNSSHSPSHNVPGHSPKQTPVKHKDSNNIPVNANTPIKSTPHNSLGATPKSTRHTPRKTTPPLILISDSPEYDKGKEDSPSRYDTVSMNGSFRSSSRQTTPKKVEKKTRIAPKKVNWKSLDKSFNLDSSNSSNSSNDKAWVPDKSKQKKKKYSSLVNGKIKKRDKNTKKSAAQKVLTRSPSSRPSSRNEAEAQNGIDSAPEDRPEDRPQRRAKKKGPGSFAEPRLNKKLRRP